MFDSTTINSNIKLNPACNGMLQKSHPKSRFISMTTGSNLYASVFNNDGGEEPFILKGASGSTNKVKITVIQVMVFGDKNCICEIVFNEDLK